MQNTPTFVGKFPINPFAAVIFFFTKPASTNLVKCSCTVDLERFNASVNPVAVILPVESSDLRMATLVSDDKTSIESLSMIISSEGMEL